MRGDNATVGPGRLARARNRALLIGLPLITALMFTSAAVIYQQPVHQTWQWLSYLGSGLVCLGMIWPAWQAVRRDRRRTRELIGAVALTMLSLVVLARIAGLLFDVAVQDPSINLFRPAFAFLPGLFLGALLLLPSRNALALSWTVWIAVLLLLAAAIAVNGWTLSRAGLPELCFWILLGNPLFLLAMHALPGLEDALQRSVEEIGELRERTRLMERVAASEHRFNLVVESLQVGVWDYRFSPEGRITERWWSPRFFELLGYEPEQMMANEDNANLILGSEAQAARLTMLAALKATGSAQFDVRLHTRQRGLRWFNVSASAERDANGRVLRATGAIEDIHARRMAEIELKEAQAELVALAYRDPLTALPNRRAFDEQFQREWDRARRSGASLSLMSIDIDWFKSYNDRYGHPAGDECLRRVAEVINECLRRPGDFAARVGGEEFQVVMPETDAAGALRVAQLLESSLRERAIPHAGSAFGRVTCSIGVASEAAVAQSKPEILLSRADQGLYESKRSGRSQVRGGEAVVA